MKCDTALSTAEVVCTEETETEWTHVGLEDVIRLLYVELEQST